MIPGTFYASIIPVDLTGDDDLTSIVLQASFDGRLKSAEGFLSAAGDLATLTAAAGKDLYVTAAKITMFANNTSLTNAVADEVVLKVNGTIVETTKYTWSTFNSSSDAGVVSFSYDFKNIGGKAAPAQILKIEVILLDAQTDVEGFIQAVEVPTGQNPVTYTGA